MLLFFVLFRRKGLGSRCENSVDIYDYVAFYYFCFIFYCSVLADSIREIRVQHTPCTWLGKFVSWKAMIFSVLLTAMNYRVMELKLA